jgi:hypothetical protein
MVDDMKTGLEIKKRGSEIGKMLTSLANSIKKSLRTMSHELQTDICAVSAER